MTTCIFVPQRAYFSRQFTRVVNESVKYCSIQGAGQYSAQKGPTDAVGSTTVTFSGVVATSEIRVYLPNGTEQAGIESCAADQVLTWPVYAIGESNNTVTIRIVHPDYKIKEFTYTSTLGNQSIPVQMERDKWFRNP
jgi:hypothetical protein